MNEDLCPTGNGDFPASHVNFLEGLWLVNLPPLTYPPKNKASFTAYEPLVSLNKALF